MTKKYIWIECWSCSGHGIVDRSYHNPGECPTCNGKGSVILYPDSGRYAKYPSGPFLGREKLETLHKEI